MTEPPKKRSRRQEEGTGHGEARTQDSEVWFEDGNMILVAQNVEFRVYKGPLIKQSPVFRDMLSVPVKSQRVSDSSHLPVVLVTDHPNDIRRLLAGFMFGNEMRFTNTVPGFAVISSIIRMGRKYGIDAAVEVGVEFLKSRYPTEYADWKNAREGPPSFLAVESIGVINLARLTDTPQLLPAAFYKVATLDTNDIISGFARDDGVVEELSRADLARVLIARAELMKRNAYNVAACSFTGIPAAMLCPRSRCKDQLRMLCQRVGSSKEAGPDLCENWESYMHKLGMPMCQMCAEQSRRMGEEWLKNIWASWPETLGIKDELD